MRLANIPRAAVERAAKCIAYIGTHGRCQMLRSLSEIRNSVCTFMDALIFHGVMSQRVEHKSMSLREFQL